MCESSIINLTPREISVIITVLKDKSDRDLKRADTFRAAGNKDVSTLFKAHAVECKDIFYKMARQISGDKIEQYDGILKMLECECPCDYGICDECKKEV